MFYKYLIGILSLGFLVLSESLLAQNLSYHKDIKTIIDKKCLDCHKKNGIAPINLETYENVVSNSRMIEFVTSIKYMPPFIADVSYNHYENERRISSEEFKILQDWINSGMPEGDAQISMKEESKKTKIEDPDLIISMAEAFEHYGIYYDQFQVFVIPYNIEKDEYIQAIEFVPGDPQIVRSCSVSLDNSMSSDSLDRWDPRYGYTYFGGVGFEAEQPIWFHWNAGDRLTFYDKDKMKLLPKSANVLMHINYGPFSEKRLDSSYIKIKFYSGEIKPKEIKTQPLLNQNDILNPPFIIEPNETKKFHLTRILEEDIQLISLFPNGQLLCKSWEVYAKTPEGKTHKLLRINDWDMHWKRSYILKEALTLPKGTKIHGVVSYDNTVHNFSNPTNPPTRIDYGHGMFDENPTVVFEFIKL